MSVNSGLKATKIIGQRKALNKDKMDMQNCASASSIHELCQFNTQFPIQQFTIYE